MKYLALEANSSGMWKLFCSYLILVAPSERTSISERCTASFICASARCSLLSFLLESGSDEVITFWSADAKVRPQGLPSKVFSVVEKQF